MAYSRNTPHNYTFLVYEPLNSFNYSFYWSLYALLAYRHMFLVKIFLSSNWVNPIILVLLCWQMFDKITNCANENNITQANMYNLQRSPFLPIVYYFICIIHNVFLKLIWITWIMTIFLFFAYLAPSGVTSFHINNMTFYDLFSFYLFPHKYKCWTFHSSVCTIITKSFCRLTTRDEKWNCEYIPSCFYWKYCGWFYFSTVFFLIRMMLSAYTARRSLQKFMHIYFLIFQKTIFLVLWLEWFTFGHRY